MNQRITATNGLRTVVMQAALFSSGIALCVPLTGCEVGPNYAGPPETKLASFHNPKIIATTQASPATETWWEGFNDPELTKIIHRALNENLDLAAAIARVDQAQAAARGASAQLLPTADANASVTSVHQSLESPIGAIGTHLPGFHRDVSFFDAGLGASWEIDVSGGLRRGVESAEAEYQAAEAERLGVRVSVVAEAADAYFQIRSYQTRINVADEQVKTDQQLLDLVKVRKTFGVGADREVAQAEALLRNAKATLPPLRIGLDAQLNRLDVLLGKQPGTYAMELTRTSAMPMLPGIDASTPASDLLRRRPDVIAAERRLAASNAQIGVATSAYYPKISLSGLLGFESMDATRLFKSATFQPEAVGGLRWRLFDFGKVDAEVAQAKGAHAEALSLYRKLILRATEDVENAFMALAQHEIQADEIAHEEAALIRARDVAQQDYEAGSASLTDVLDADRQLLDARDRLAQTRADRYRNAVACYRALGGGW